MKKTVFFLLCLTFSTFILNSCEDPEEEVEYEDVSDDDWKKKFITNNDSINIGLLDISELKKNQ